MTVSKNDRIHNIPYALTLFIGDLNDHAISEVPLAQSNPAYSAILATTWQVLRDRYWLRQITNTDIHWMTGAGWYAGVKAAGKLDEQWFKDQMSKLAAALKRLVKRQQVAGHATVRSTKKLLFIISSLERCYRALRQAAWRRVHCGKV